MIQSHQYIPIARGTMKESTSQKLLSVMTEQQLELFADMLLRVQEHARDRRCDQTLEIYINDKGYPRYFNGSDNIRLVLERNVARETA